MSEIILIGGGVRVAIISGEGVRVTTASSPM